VRVGLAAALDGRGAALAVLAMLGDAVSVLRARFAVGLLLLVRLRPKMDEEHRQPGQHHDPAHDGPDPEHALRALRQRDDDRRTDLRLVARIVDAGGDRLPRILDGRRARRDRHLHGEGDAGAGLQGLLAVHREPVRLRRVARRHRTAHLDAVVEEVLDRERRLSSMRPAGAGRERDPVLGDGDFEARHGASVGGLERLDAVGRQLVLREDEVVTRIPFGARDALAARTDLGVVVARRRARRRRRAALLVLAVARRAVAVLVALLVDLLQALFPEADKRVAPTIRRPIARAVVARADALVVFLVHAPEAGALEIARARLARPQLADLAAFIQLGAALVGVTPGIRGAALADLVLGLLVAVVMVQDEIEVD